MGVLATLQEGLGVSWELGDDPDLGVPNAGGEKKIS